MAAQNQQSGPKTAFGKYMVYKFIPQYANNVYGLVYMGAAILIIIVGLRGLGAAAYSIPIVPKFLMDEASKKIDVNYVMFALFLEFFLLLLMALVTFFTPEEPAHNGEEAEAPQGMTTMGKTGTVLRFDAATFQAEIENIQNFTNEEMKIVDGYVNKIAESTKRLNAAKQEFFKALADMKQIMKS